MFPSTNPEDAYDASVNDSWRPPRPRSKRRSRASLPPPPVTPKCDFCDAPAPTPHKYTSPRRVGYKLCDECDKLTDKQKLARMERDWQELTRAAELQKIRDRRMENE